MFPNIILSRFVWFFHCEYASFSTLLTSAFLSFSPIHFISVAKTYKKTAKAKYILEFIGQAVVRSRVQNFFWNLTLFFEIQFKNTSNLIFLGFKVPSESFFHKNFKIGLTFWHIWFQKIENWVRTCFHIGGTLCIYVISVVEIFSGQN